MTPTETAAKLRNYNLWRRGNLEGMPQPDPREIGDAIDAAIEMIERMDKIESAAQNLVNELLDRLEDAEKDVALKEQVIDALGSELSVVANERDALRAKIEQMEQQEPECEVVGQVRNVLYEVRTLKYDLPAGVKLYALPGAQPAPSVPEDVMRDAERYRYLRARDDGTAGVGCWIEAEGRACDRGWLYGVQLDSAIDTCIEMLAAATEAKP